MKYSVRDALARSHPGWTVANADRLIAWLDQCGYAIVDKDALQASGMEGSTERKN
jgi:hypothetical protein